MHSLVPSPVLSAAPSHVPSCALSCAPSIVPSPERSSIQPTLQDPSCTPVPSGLLQLEISSNAAGKEEEGGYESDGEERNTEFLLDTEEDGPMVTAKDKSEI